MKNKKAIITLILLVLALSITSVTASDNVETTSNNTETLTTVDSADLDEIENNDKLSMNNENIEDIDDSNSIDEELSKEYNVKDMEVLGDTYIPNPSVTVKSVSTSSLTLYIVDIGGKGQMPSMNVQIDSMDYVSVNLASGYTDKISTSGGLNDYYYYYTGTLVLTGLSLSPGTAHNVMVWSLAANSNRAATSFTVPKTNPTIKIDSISEKYYNTGTYSISGTSSVNGLTITLKQGSTSLGTATVSNGKWTVSGISSTKFSPGSYTVTATSTATSSYNSASASGTLKVLKSTPIIKFSNSPSIYYGNGVYSISGTATVSSNNVNEGKVTLSFGDVVLGTSSVSNGVWTVSDIDSTLIDPSSSSYTLTASFASATNYAAASGSGSLTVGKFTPDIIIDPSSIFYNQSSGAVIAGKIYKYSGEYYEGSIDLYLNGELIASDVVVSASGSWSYTLSSTTSLSPATYSVGVVWKGNDYTNENTLTENKYTVNKGMVIPIITPPGNIDIGRSAYVHVDVNNVMGGGYLGGMTVTLQGSGIDGILEETSDGSGRATFIIPNLASGKYDDWKVSVISNDYYTPTMDSFSVSKFYVQYPLTVNITSVLPASSTYPEEIVIKGFTNAGDVPQGNVTFWLGGKNYTGFFDSTGNFTASLVGVKPGIYNYITAKYNPTEDEYYYRGVESVVSIPETGMIIC